MHRRGQRPPTLSNLPEDVFLEIAGHLEAEDVFALCSTSRYFNSFTQSRHLWSQVSQNLCNRLPLAIPPLRARKTIATSEIQSIIKRALLLEKNWRRESPAPTKPPRHLNLTSRENGIQMLRLLSGGRLFLLVTLDGRLTCRDMRDGCVVGEWKHGGNKIHSIDVDVVDDGNAMILAASVDRLKDPQRPDEGLIHSLHALRIEVSEDVDSQRPTVDFVHIMTSPGDRTWWVVSVEGDIIAAYACDMATRPLTEFAILVANWQTATDAVIHLPETIISNCKQQKFEHWPTLQVVGNQIIVHEERRCLPASLVFPVPEMFFSVESFRTLSHVKITPTIIHAGDDEDNAFQTRFSKAWPNDRVRMHGRPLTLLSISTSVNTDSKRTICVTTLDPLSTPTPRFSSPSSMPPRICNAKAWRREALVPETHDALRFTFCLGRYGSFPVWIEEDEPPPDLQDGTVYIPGLKLMGLFTDHKRGGSQHPKRMASLHGVELNDLQCLDFDDAEGILCGITETGVWLIEYL